MPVTVTSIWRQPSAVRVHEQETTEGRVSSMYQTGTCASDVCAPVAVFSVNSN